MQSSLVIVMVSSVVTLTACNSAPALPGFQSGTISGTECPPGSVADGSCSSPDCGVACVAATSCASHEACPADTTCDTLEGDAWCVPTACTADDTCGDSKTCETHRFSKGVCVSKTTQN